MPEPSITVEDPTAAVREWFEKLALYCSTVDYESARAIFSPEVASFGTQADAVAGLERLQAEQWEQIWPRTSGFRVLMETVRAGGDANVAWGMATWSSLGYDERGNSFERPGRATVVLTRSTDRWTAVHTHFSLFRGVDQRTYGAR
ncbi:MAG: YybH family protein [Actinomycetota bacterium]